MIPQKKIEKVQQMLKEQRVDGWLIYDFHRRNNLACYFLGIPNDQMLSRRFFYWIPKNGTPIKILHRIEMHAISNWPGLTKEYLSWQSLEKTLKQTLKGMKKIAMEYSPKNAIPYISMVDAGTVELVESFNVEVISSAEILSQFTSVLNEDQIAMQASAGKHLDWVASETWRYIKNAVDSRKTITEYDVQQYILSKIEDHGYVTEGAPICAVNEHSADPHYLPLPKGSKEIRKGDFVLIDLWCKLNKPKAVFADITRVAVLRNKGTKRELEIFKIVREAQLAATQFIRSRIVQGQDIQGYEVDDVCRSVIRDAGFGEHFIHRTGHSIDINLHGNGTHIDNLEMHDERLLLPGMCFSVEPGIYLPGEFGVRLEYDIIIRKHQKMDVSGGEEDSLLCLYP